MNETYKTTQFPIPNPTPKTKIPSWAKYVGTILIGGLVGAGLTTVGHANSEAEPVPTATVTATPESVIPESCQQCVELADEMMALAGKGFDAAATNMEAQQNLFANFTEQGLYDYAASLEEYVYDLGQTNNQVYEVRPKYDTAKDRCLTGK